MVVIVLEGPAARAHAGPLLGPVARDLEHLSRLEPGERGIGARFIGVAARLHHRMRGEHGVPDRRDAGLAIGFLRADHQQPLDRLPRGGARRMVLGIAQAVEHHHAVRHRRIDRTEPVDAVDPLDHPVGTGLDRPRAQLFRPQPVAGLEQPVEPVEALGPDPLRVRRLRGAARGAAGIELVDLDAARVARERLERAEHQQRHHHRARPIAHLRQMDREPARQQDQLGRHGRHHLP